MFSRAFCLLLFSCVIVSGAQAGGDDWRKVREAEGELAFLESLVAFALTVDREGFATAIGDLEDLPELRRQAAVTVVLDQWMRTDAESLREVMDARWEELDPVVHENFFQWSLRLEPESTARRLFDEDDPASAYRDGLMHELTRRHPRIAAEHLSAIKDPDERSGWANRIARGWMQSSPEEAFEWAALNDEAVDLKQLFLSAVYSRDNAATDFKLVELWARLPEAARTDELRRDVANHLLYAHPGVALDFIEELPDAERYPLLHRAMDRLAESKSPRAAELLRLLPAEHLPNSGTLKKVLLEWGLREPEQALIWAEAISNTALREDAVVRMNTVLGMLDPQLAIDHALSQPPGVLRRTMIRNVALLLAKEDLSAGLAWVDALPESGGKKLALESITLLMDRVPPREMLAAALEMKQAGLVTDFINRVFSRWCSYDIEGAAQWYFSLPEAEQNPSREGVIGPYLANRAPELALEYLFSKTIPISTRKKIFSSYMNTYSSHPEMLAELTKGLKPEHVGTLLEQFEVRNLFRFEPLMAMELAAQLPERDRTMAIMRGSQSWLESDPIGIAAYLETDELDIRFNYARVAGKLAERDFERAVAWVERLEIPEHRNYGYMGLARHIASDSPAEALRLMEETEAGARDNNRHARDQTYDQIFQDWAYFEPAAAQMALDRSPALSEKQKSRITKLIKDQKPKPR